jgi:hypothetical protein
MSEQSHVGLMQCFFCGAADRIAIDTRLRDSLPHQAVHDMEPCPQCQGRMQQGVILISVRDGEMEKVEAAHRAYKQKFNRTKPTQFIPNPYRSGGWWVVTDTAIRAMLNEPLATQILRQRWAFIPHSIAEQVGLFKLGEELQQQEKKDDGLRDAGIEPCGPETEAGPGPAAGE